MMKSTKDRSPGRIIIPPILLEISNNLIECCLHQPSWRFKKEIQRVFPLRNSQEILIFSTFQKCHLDLVGIGKEIEDEKDEKLNQFNQLFYNLKSFLETHFSSNLNIWIDACDPSSGYPIIESRGLSPYPEVEAAHTLLRYPIQNSGCCNVLLHPKWGSKVYPATIFIDISCQDLILNWLNDKVKSIEISKFNMIQENENSNEKNQLENKPIHDDTKGKLWTYASASSLHCIISLNGSD